MAVTVTAMPLINAQYAPTSTSSPVYTAPSSTNAIIDKFTATEVTGATPTITVWIVPSGQTIATDYKVIDAEAMTANTCLDITELKNHVLATGDRIFVQSSAASQIVIRCSGRQAVTS